MSALFLSNIDIMVACGSVILAVLVGGGAIFLWLEYCPQFLNINVWSRV